MARMTGVGAPELVDPKTFPEIVSTLVATTSQAGARVGAQQLALQRADGEVLDVSVTTARVRAAAGSDGEQGWVQVLTVHDETRERRVERMKTDFVATVSHELRTPITPIKGYAKLLATRRDRMSPEKVTEKLQVIASSADHLERLVDDLLMAQRVSGRANLRVEMGVADLADVIRASVDGFPALMEKIRVELPPETISVQCDRERAVQCLANLIGNAVKYAPGELIEVTTRAKGLQVQVVVRDHGAGIPQAEHERVFERFYRREDPFTMRTGGAGLGLHISRELSVAMGGGLTLEQPEEGTGCVFVLHLLTTAAPPHNQPSTTDSAGATPASPPAPRQHDTMSLEGAPEGAQ